MRFRTTAGLWFTLAFAVLLLPLPWIAALTLSSLFHELCHLVAAKLTGVPVLELQIGAGGAYLKIGDMTPFQEFVCALAGPLGALLLLLSARWMPRTAICAAIQSAYHLLPLYPLDGGKALHSLTTFFGFPPVLHQIVEYAVMFGLVLIGLSLLRVGFGFLPLIGVIAILFRVFREKYLAKRSGTGYNRDTSI